MKFKTLALGAVALALPALAQAAAPARFLQDVISADNGEVAMGKLAQMRSRDPAVRAFGRTLEQDHGMNRQQAIDLARSMRIRVAPNVVNPASAQARQRLTHLWGANFDREFARVMVSDHRKDIAKFEVQSRMRGDPTAGFARDTLPHLRRHLDMAMAIRR